MVYISLYQNFVLWSYGTKCLFFIGGFHVMSYQTNFASHRLSSYSRLLCWFPVCMKRFWEKQQNSFITVYLVHTTLPKYKRVARISPYTWWKLQLFPWSKYSIPYCAKENQEMLPHHAHVIAYHVMQTLYLFLFVFVFF